MARRRWIRVAAWAVALGLLALAFVALRQRWEAVGEAGGLPGLVPSLTAAMIHLVANVVLAWNWRAIVAVAGPRLAFRQALWIWSASQLARYTFGFAQVGSRAVIARGHGVSVTAGVLSTLLELAWLFTVASAIVLATAPWWLPAAGGVRWLAWAALVPVAGVIAALASPRALLRVLDRLARVGWFDRLTRARFRDVGSRARLDRATLARFVARYGTNTVLRHTAFLTLFTAVGGDLRTAGLVAVGAYALGSLAGAVAVFAPGGLGVREGMTALVLAPVIGGGPALLLVAAVRLLEVIAELALLGLARILRPDASGYHPADEHAARTDPGDDPGGDRAR